MDDQKVLIDTSVIIEHFRKTNKTSTTLFQLPENLQKVISVITIFEFKIGIRNRSVLDFWNEMTLFFDVLNINQTTIHIAASAIEHNIPFLTLNKKHFERIKDIVLFNKQK
jgi:predicted nucleic acid-binding protein